MPRKVGRSVRPSLVRRIIGDFLHASRRGVFVTFEREMGLAEVRVARDEHPARPPWSVLFLKALALVAHRCPELRRAYLRWPWPWIYEHPSVIGSIIVARDLGGEEYLFCVPLPDADRATVYDLAATVRRAKEQPPARVRPIRRALRLARYPFPLRRFLWSWLDWSGKLRADYIGTFGISATAGTGASALNLITPWSAALCFAPFRPDGTLPVRLTFDHRLFDGSAASRILSETEAALTGPVLMELSAAGATTIG